MLVEEGDEHVKVKRDFADKVMSGSISAVVVGLLVWVGTSITSMETNQAEFKTSIEYIQRDITAIKSEVRDQGNALDIVVATGLDEQDGSQLIRRIDRLESHHMQSGRGT